MGITTQSKALEEIIQIVAHLRLEEGDGLVVGLHLFDHVLGPNEDVFTVAQVEKLVPHGSALVHVFFSEV